MRKKNSVIHLGAFQVLKSRLDCYMMQQCAHNQDELPCVTRGVTIHPLWHIGFPCGGLRDAFGNSATTGQLLPKCRYFLPPASHFGSNVPTGRKIFADTEKKKIDRKQETGIKMKTPCGRRTPKSVPRIPR
jgi:hypothetical protein